jgi:hypothetical protein
MPKQLTSNSHSQKTKKSKRKQIKKAGDKVSSDKTKIRKYQQSTLQIGFYFSPCQYNVHKYSDAMIAEAFPLRHILHPAPIFQ